MLTVISLNFFMSIYRAPTVALMPDFTPPPLRSKANGIINLRGGLGASFAYLLGGVLFKINEYYSFAAGSSILIITIILMYGFIREPKEVSWENQEKTQNVSGERLNERDKGETVSLIFLLLAIFSVYGFNAVETFFSTYGEKVLNIDKSLSSYLLLTVSALFLVFAHLPDLLQEIW